MMMFYMNVVGCTCLLTPGLVNFSKGFVGVVKFEKVTIRRTFKNSFRFLLHGHHVRRICSKMHT